MSLLTGLLFEDKKDRARIDAEKQLREHFSKHGKVVDYTDKGFVIDGDVELSHKFTGSKLPVKFDTVSFGQRFERIGFGVIGHDDRIVDLVDH